MAKKHKGNKVLLASLALGAVAIAVGLLLWHKSKNPALQTGNAGVVTMTDSKGHKISANPSVPGGTTGSDAASSVKLVKPFGDFLSNHVTNLDPNNDRNQEQSACSTSVGATCQIEFILNGKIVKLPAMKAASNHNEQIATAIWPTWSPANLGLTTGKWEVRAIATLDSQTQTSEDVLTVE